MATASLHAQALLYTQQRVPHRQLSSSLPAISECEPSSSKSSPFDFFHAVRRCLPSQLRETEAPASDSVIRLEYSHNGAVLTLRYPHRCAGGDFMASYAEVAALLAESRSPFALIHDLRGTDLSTIALDVLIADATSIASHGMVQCVAFVMDVNPALRATIALGLVICPVQPARVFSSGAEASAWAAPGGRR